MFSKDSDKQDNRAVDEWNRTIKDAIEQAKRELFSREQKENNNSGNEDSPNEPQNKKHNDKRAPRDFITTLGHVMQELPLQIEGFFDHGLSGDIYAEQIRFFEPRHSGINVSGRGPYMGVARVLRIAMNAYFSQPTVAIVSMRQLQMGATGETNGDVADNESGVAQEVDAIQQRQFEVFVRWVFEGVPRHSELMGDGQVSRFEGEFRYRIDPASGLISEHEVTAIHPAPPTGIFASSGLARWAGWLAPRGSLSLARQSKV
ncbi:hypothetical protein J3B02_000484 [Coemansia erecta]|uniref:Uncharacterized protein n=1 Tax=Coemansia asiatica TaxID=1052880 RepID=A0A9W7XPJ4_9FUNG|nr:hypothetical protein LPJ64_001695 [Coemansia asiatica]KAJ2858144.1 hypothetical protein J3B02_000484 [Coemansia erecta]KAJ2863329.1 hypothetical protein FB639_005298 [Coemansia asiatica]